MAIPSEARARVRGGTPPPVGGRCNAGPGTRTLALATALDRALLAAQRLRDALDTAARQQAELATLLAGVLALAGPGTPHDAGHLACSTHTAPDEEPAARPTSTRTPTSLSPREREVLRLLAAGHSNRLIAADLFLSPRTVQRHVANVYLKLGAHCRAEATVYALRHNLT